jgi:hypothetical protein
MAQQYGYATLPVAGQQVLGLNSRDTGYTPSIFTKQTFVESVFVDHVKNQALQVDAIYPELSFIDALAKTVAWTSEGLVQDFDLPISTPAMGKLKQQIQNVYKANDSAAPAPSFGGASVFNIFNETQANSFKTPFLDNDNFSTVSEGSTFFGVQGPMQTVTRGQGRFTLGDTEGFNLMLLGDDASVMKNPMMILKEATEAGTYAANLAKNVTALMTVMAAGPITTVNGTYGGNEMLGVTNQNDYQTVDIFNSTAVAGAGVAPYQFTPTADGMMTGMSDPTNRRIIGRNVPTKIINGSNQPITQETFEKLKIFMAKTGLTQQEDFAFVVDHIYGMSQIQKIPQHYNMETSSKPLKVFEERYVYTLPKKICGLTVLGCPSIVPLGAAKTTYGVVGPTSPKRKAIIIGDKEKFNVSIKKDPLSDPQHLVMTGKQRYGVGIQNHNLLAVVPYNALV